MADEPVGTIEVDSLSEHELFAWAFHLAERAEIAVQKGGLPPQDQLLALETIRDFYAAMADIYGLKTRQDIMLHRSRWVEHYRLGVKGLAERGLVRVERTAEGSYAVVQMFPEKLAPTPQTLVSGPRSVS